MAVLGSLCLGYAQPEAAAVVARDASAAEKHPSRPRPPNIVAIMADDMRADDLRWMPATRRLIQREGVSFENAFVSLPLCAPSRSSFLTGQYAHNHKVFGNRRRWGFHAFDDSSTIATDVQRAGYRTGLVGKYINGYGDMPPRGDSGRGGSRHYVPRGWSAWYGAPMVTAGPMRGGPYDYRLTTLSHDGALRSLRGRYNTREFGGVAAHLITRWGRGHRPFFLFESYVAPHFGSPQEADDPPVLQSVHPDIKVRTPAVTARVRGSFDSVITRARSEGEIDVSDKPAWVRQLPIASARSRAAIVESQRQRAEALAELDRQVARTVSALRRTHELRRTVIIFTSDNGWFENEHRIEADKSVPYGPAIGVPLLMRGPSLPRGIVRHGLVVNADLAPTIDDLANARTARVVDGRSLLPLARHGGTRWREAVLVETGPPRTLDDFARQAMEISRMPYNPRRRAVIGVRTARFSYLRWSSGEVELYDLRRDPGELRNVVSKPAYSNEAAALRALLHRLRRCSGPACSR
jgi:N-acetylglucosamine-6-sulfatase